MMKGGTRASWLRWLAYGLLAAYAGGYVLYIVLHPESLQWDFRTYYYAAQAFLRGLDPYRLRSLSEVAGAEIGYPFAYSPLSLVLLSPLSLLSYQAAYFVFLLLKVMAFVLLTQLWRKSYLQRPHSPLFYAFCLIGFAGATVADFAAGNISVFEQFLLWSAFYLLQKGRPGLFSLLVILASVFKVLPVVFLGLLLLTGRRDRIRHFLLSAASFAALMLLAWLVFPDLTQSFLGVASTLEGRGIQSPSTLALLRDSADLLGARGIALPAVLPTVILGVIAAAILATTWLSIRRAGPLSLKSLIYLACLVFALVVPRLKSYSYMLLLLPAYELATRGLQETGIPWALLLLMISPRFFVPFGFAGELTDLFWSYYPVFAAFVVWLGSVILLWKGRGLDAQQRDPSAAEASSPP